MIINIRRSINAHGNTQLFLPSSITRSLSYVLLMGNPRAPKRRAHMGGAVSGLFSAAGPPVCELLKSPITK